MSALFALVAFPGLAWVVHRTLDVDRRLDAHLTRLSLLLHRQFVFVSPRTLSTGFRISILSSVVLGGAFQSISIPMLTAAIAASAFALVQAIESHRKRRFDRQFNPWVKSFLSFMETGQSIESALGSSLRRQSPPLSQELSLVLKEVSLGHSVEASLTSLLDRYPGKDLELFTECVSLSLRSGSPLVTVLASLCEVLDRRASLQEKLESMTLQGRAQGWIGVAIPILLFASVQALSPGYFDPLYAHPQGLWILGACAVSLLAGAAWIYRLSKAVRL